MDKHTPGPWFVSAAKDCIWHKDHGRICTPPNHAQVWNWEPNARLIAAAPDMLEALKVVAADSRWISGEPNLLKVRAAIAKATGEAS